MNPRYVWQKSQLQEAVEQLPRAVRCPITVNKKFGRANSFDELPDLEEPVSTENYHAIIVNGKMVGAVSPQYKLVQHKDAFRPIADGLDRMGIDADYNLFTHKGKAWLSVLVENAADTVRIGFSAMNSVDGTTAIRYAFAMQSVTKTVELVGYRQVCSNGMKIRVPLQNAEIVKLETREEIEKLMEQHQNIVHMGDPKSQIQAIQYVVEAVAMLKDSVSTIIERAQNYQIEEKAVLKELISVYVGKRMSQKIEDQFYKEHPSVWGLYNAITNVASHADIAETTSTGLIDKAAVMLEKLVC